MQASSIRDAARHLVDSLPDDATWEDLMDEIYVRQAIERGLEDSRSGKTLTIAEVRAQFGLKS
jgi:hypothetical protein